MTICKNLLKRSKTQFKVQGCEKNGLAMAGGMKKTWQIFSQ